MQAVSVKRLAVIQCHAVVTCSIAGNSGQQNGKTVFRSIAIIDVSGDVASHLLRSLTNRQNGTLFDGATTTKATTQIKGRSWTDNEVKSDFTYFTGIQPRPGLMLVL